jgi:hypothetical protein
MEELLDVIENEIKQREDYSHHLRFGTRIVFKTRNSMVHWIIIDSYTTDENDDVQDLYLNDQSENQ